MSWQFQKRGYFTRVCQESEWKETVFTAQTWTSTACQGQLWKQPPWPLSRKMSWAVTFHNWSPRTLGRTPREDKHSALQVQFQSTFKTGWKRSTGNGGKILFTFPKSSSRVSWDQDQLDLVPYNVSACLRISVCKWIRTLALKGLGQGVPSSRGKGSLEETQKPRSM